MTHSKSIPVLTALWLLFVFGTVAAQTPGSLPTSKSGVIGAAGRFVPAFGNRAAGSTQRNSYPDRRYSFEQPLSNAVALSYYDTALTSYVWYGGALYNPYTIVEFGERITLSSNSGFVDSVSVTLDSISQDSVHIALYPDTLCPVGSGFFHLINVFDQNVLPYWSSSIQSTQIHGRTRVTIAVPHIAVPQNFFVLLAPSFASTGQLSNFYFWPADSEASRTRTVDNTHSAWVGSANGQVYSAILDGTFVASAGSSAIFSNFYTTAYVEEGPAGVTSADTPSGDLKIFPNPASNQVEVSSTNWGMTQSLLVTDQLGRTVLDLTRAFGSTNDLRIPTSNLPAGVYEVVRRDAQKTQISRLVVVH